MMKLSVLSTALVTLALISGAAQAVTHTYGGDTTDGPIFDRPFEELDGLSTLGRDSNYSALAFTVSASGSYSFMSTAVGWDNFLILYSPSFDPTDSLMNAKIANDDFDGEVGKSGFEFALTEGTGYVLVTTGFEGGVDFGTFANTITGPGMVNAVPEPASYAMMALGLLCIGGWVRRRNAD